MDKLREQYKEKFGKNVPVNKKNDTEWITEQLIQSSDKTETIKKPSIEEQLAKMQAQIESVKKENSLLKKVADQRKLERFTPRDEQQTICKISLYKGKVVTSWRVLDDISENYGKDYIQNLEITLEDGETVKVPTERFHGQANGVIEKVPCPVIETKVRGGKTFYVIDYNDKEYEFHAKFLN